MGTIHSAEIGDGTYVCETIDETYQMLDMLNHNQDILIQMNENIIKNNRIGIYDCAYNAVKLAVNKTEH